MRYLALAALFLATACGHGLDPADDSMANECAVEGLHSVKSEKKISCRNFSINVAIARDMMISRGWIKDAAEFNQRYSGVAVEMVNRKCISGPSIFQWIPLKGCIYGYYQYDANEAWRQEHHIVTGYPVATIMLNWDGYAMAHEFMHHYDQYSGRRATMTQAHEGWEQLGYYRFADDYVLSALQLN